MIAACAILCALFPGLSRVVVRPFPGLPRGVARDATMSAVDLSRNSEGRSLIAAGPLRGCRICHACRVAMVCAAAVFRGNLDQSHRLPERQRYPPAVMSALAMFPCSWSLVFPCSWSTAPTLHFLLARGLLRVARGPDMHAGVPHTNPHTCERSRRSEGPTRGMSPMSANVPHLSLPWARAQVCNR